MCNATLKCIVTHYDEFQYGITMLCMGKHLESYKVLIGRKLRDRRLEFGFKTQDDLATRIGSEQGQISRWESGKYIPEGQLRAALCEALKVSDSFFEMVEITKTDKVSIEEAMQLLDAYKDAKPHVRDSIRALLGLDVSEPLIPSQADHEGRAPALKNK